MLGTQVQSQLLAPGLCLITFYRDLGWGGQTLSPSQRGISSHFAAAEEWAGMVRELHTSRSLYYSSLQTSLKKH